MDIFYEKLSKPLRIHCFVSIKYVTKNYELVILTTLVVVLVLKVIDSEEYNCKKCNEKLSII